MIKKVRSHHSFMVNYSLLLFRAFTRPAMVFVFFLTLSAVTASAFAIFYFENSSNDQINNFLDALYYTVTIFTGVGLGDIAPVTVPGRIISMAIMLVGTILYVSFTAVIAATIISLEALSRQDQALEKTAKAS